MPGLLLQLRNKARQQGMTFFEALETATEEALYWLEKLEEYEEEKAEMKYYLNSSRVIPTDNLPF